MRVGFAGLGSMGGGMCRRLADRGFDVTVFDIDREAVRSADRHPGIEGASDIPGLAAPVVVTMLPDGSAVRQVADVLLPRLGPGSLLVDTGSSAPSDTLKLGRVAADHGVTVVDAPVSGSPAAARAGELTLMAAGTPDALDRAEVVLSALGRVHRVGPAGAGHALKALNNLLSAVNLAAVAEVMITGRAFGLDPAVMLEVINASTGRNHASQTKLPDHVLSGTFDSGFALRLMLKDIRIATSLQAEAGGPAAFGTACGELWEKAFAELPGNADNVEVVRWLEGVAGRDLRPATAVRPRQEG
ncbi:NAD(P)-dependent oxidoreductase [Streptomyces sp. SID2888]|uniref:NAD(P)-dependent oxidoreductase n=1 Tax=Streptomyces sp. SID2888 TaxID=2690256 RepID=UPI00137FCEE9|nr:NAD(P)-dependent oxidoreductase [Streptomyces sp. SID2888]MYV45645.1 NAD-binding protein [Streptomyces sp. SID2888]